MIRSLSTLSDDFTVSTMRYGDKEWVEFIPGIHPFYCYHHLLILKD